MLAHMKIAELHDATLEKIEIDWHARICRVVALGDTVRWQILIESFLGVSLPREEPWGPSVLINTVTQSEDRLDIELQSGDPLVFLGKIQISKAPI